MSRFLPAFLVLLLQAFAPDAAAKFLQVDAGRDHTCAVTTDGAVACWGNNSYEQLGSDTNGNHQPTAQIVPGSTEVMAVSAGGDHTCVVTTGGSVACWGRNSEGQLGIGAADLDDHPTPQPIGELASGVLAISAGETHTCALKSDGSVVCWGDNETGQLGTGNFDAYFTPQPVNGLDSGVLAISAGKKHTCALKSDGSVVCWGANDKGQLGSSADNFDVQPTPQLVLDLPKPAAAISTGSEESCARLVDGGVACWGANDDGQLGTVGGDVQPLPQPVAGLTGVVAIAAGGHTCALLAGGTVACMGDNSYGQLGTGLRSTAAQPVPQTVAELNLVTALSAGNAHTCALTASGMVVCWGNNNSGQLGNGVNVVEPTPQPVGGELSGVVALTAGWYHTCALTSTKQVACWGSNDFGQLGIDAPAGDPQPLPQWLELTEVEAISAGLYHTCALSEGSVTCWGSNGYGQLGTGDFESYSTPQPVVGLAGMTVIAISTGGSTSTGAHTCALTSTHTVFCWGANESGQVTGSAGGNKPTPQGLALAGIVEITTGGAHTCARSGSGDVWCWGRNEEGQLGRGSIGASPGIELVPGLSEAISIQAGYQFTCAARAGLLTNPIYCWGSDGAGQIGNGNVMGPQASPQLVGQLWALLDVGPSTACADASVGNNVVECWGSNSKGQLGTGSFGSYPSRTPSPGFAGVSAMAIGALHACGLQPGGTVICSGASVHGQRGDGILGYEASPQAVIDPLQVFGDGFEQ